MVVFFYKPVEYRAGNDTFSI